MQYRLSDRSLNNLIGVHEDLVRVVKKAIHVTPIDFAVIEGVRSIERQRKLVRAGASTTMNSRHITGHAVDLMAYIDGRGSWEWPLYEKIAIAMKETAERLGVPIEWGGDWTSLKDGPHFQLPWQAYPA